MRNGEVDMDSEEPIPERKRRETARRLSLDEVWPVRSVGSWPKGLSLRREDIYDDRIERAEPFVRDRDRADLTEN